MDLSEKKKFGIERRNGDQLNYHHTSSLSSEWQLDPSAIENPMNSSSSPCPSVSMVDSFCADLYNQQTNPHNPIGKPLSMDWNPSLLPSSLSNLPADSGFIERAARFSCFNGGSFSTMVNNPVTANEPLSPYPSASKGVSASQSPMNDQRDIRGSNNESGEAEFRGDGPENSSSRGSDAKKRKRTDQDMELDQAQGTSPSKKNLDTKQKGEKSSTVADAKAAGKNAKDSADGPKEDYIHVRARRGQATNSHSLAERVRREKISERMKFLQDLVPGCSKVTGKAIMLDEIINYVQSLQRQVEFLSMKLAAVNPRLDFNIEGLLSKDVCNISQKLVVAHDDLLHLRAGGSSGPGFSPEMIHIQLHNLQQGLVQAGIPGMGNPSDALRRAINAQLTSTSGYKEPLPQMPNGWEDELHNVVQMNSGSNLLFNAPELNTKPRDGFSL